MNSGESARAPMQIRRILESDKEPLRELRLRALSADPMAFAETLEELSKKEDSFWVGWARRASASEDATSFVAVGGDGELVGLVGSIWQEDATWLGAMWVEPRYRAMGVGARLLDAVIAWSETAHPVSRIRLSVVPTQETAVRLYRSRGFVPTGKVSPLQHTPGAVFHEMVRRPTVSKRSLN
jgi:GNAT superfamily N-acetyltransferase